MPFAPFHGGFGLVANGCIPKPTFYTFKFYKQLTGECVYKDDSAVIVKTEKGYRLIAWNACPMGEDKKKEIDISLPASGEYSVIMSTVDETTCNPLKLWHDMGEPRSLSKPQLRLLKDAAKPLVTSERTASEGGRLSLKLSLSRNAVVYLEAERSELTPDRGFDYVRATTGM